MDNRLGRVGRFEGLYRVSHDRVLLRRIERRSRGMAERKIDEGGARWPSRLHNVQSAAQAESRNTGGFEVTGNQTHGLMAHGSHGYEECRVDVLRPVGVQHCWG